MIKLKAKNKIVWALALPVWILLELVIFTVATYPLSFLVSIGYPKTMSRIMVFETSILSITWALLFLITIIKYSNQYYALVGEVEEHPTCFCMCEYRMRDSAFVSLSLASILFITQITLLGLRGLKGLRHPEWANLFTVLYTVPVESFPVRWERPVEAGGGPIAMRKPGEPVQGEPAFDPFCLMDEQPESAFTRPLIQLARPTAGHSQGSSKYLHARIGCCGFPAADSSSSEDSGSDYVDEDL